MKVSEQDRFIVSVRVGPKGQITVPVEGRRMFQIKEGDTLMVMGDRSRGMVLIKADEFYKQMGGVFPDGGDRNTGSSEDL